MNAFQTCFNTSDLVPLYLPQQLYLKPIARFNISLQLPNVKKLGKSISHWEIMDKIRTLIKPEEFTVLKVTKTTVEFVRFEAELETKAKLENIISKLNNKMIKLKDFNDFMRIRAAEWKSDFPNCRIWDDFFQNSKDMDEMKPGQRPDTIHLSNLPSKWFVFYHSSGEKDVMPSEKIFYRIFEKFGPIRNVDIPICDPYREKMKDHISGLKHSSFENKDFFEGYVQFKDYIGFTKTMDAFRDMKLVHKDDDCSTEINIKMEFDKSKHLSDASIRRREIVRDRLVKKAREQEERDKAELEEKKRKEELQRQKEVDLKTEKELRRKLREEKRKAKILEKLEISGTDEINEKIAKEEKKLLKVQRKLEAIRLVEELFGRIKEKNKDNVQPYDVSNPTFNELKKFKNTSELEVLTQREILHHAIKGRVMLKNILSESTKTRHYSSSSDSSVSLDGPNRVRKPASPVLQKYPELLYDPGWLAFQYQLPSGSLYPDYTDYSSMRGLFPRGRVPFTRYPGNPGSSRGGHYNRRRGNFQPHFRGGYRGGRIQRYPPELEDEYEKYFSKFLSKHKEQRYKDKESRSLSSSPTHYSRRSRSSKRRYSSSRSHSRSRSRKRSYERRAKSRSYSSTSTRSRSRKSRSSITPSRSKSSRKSSKKRHSREKYKHQRNKSKGKSFSKSRSRSRDKSVDSSTFMTPKQLEQQKCEGRRRSKSWSLPKEGEKSKERSWSKSPEK